MSHTSSYDLIVIGAGPAGYVESIRAAQLGMQVACVDRRKTLGGTCLNVGCIPSKALLESSEQYVFARTRLAKHGIMASEVRLELATMLKRKDAIVRQLTNGVAGLLKKNGVAAISGTAHLLGAGAGATGGRRLVEVDGDAGGSLMLDAPRVLLATGSVPTQLSFLPFDGRRILSSTEALSLSNVPERMVVIGGGVIGLELGSVWSRLGSQVTVIEFLDHLLGPTDRQVSEELRKILLKQGLEIRLATQCTGASVPDSPPGPGAPPVIVETEELATGNKASLEASVVLVATGRRPMTEGLGLEALGIRLDAAGRVEVSANYETSAEGVYAVGDLIAGPMLAHKAEEEGIAAVENMAGQKSHVNLEAIPNVVYTHPEIATVGASEEELKARKIAYKSGIFPFMGNGRAKSMDETEGFVKILAEDPSDRVLGVAMIGPRVSELIAEAVSVIEFGGSSEDIARTCHAHPTLAEVVKEAALAANGRALHI
jgi:dihydrolipoamide dehydrogenase